MPHQAKYYNNKSSILQTLVLSPLASILHLELRYSRLDLDPRLCIIIRLDLRAQDDVLVESKRYGFGYLLSLLSIRKKLVRICINGYLSEEISKK